MKNCGVNRRQPSRRPCGNAKYYENHSEAKILIDNSSGPARKSNKKSQSSQITALVEATRNVTGYTSKPLIFNEDDHFNFESDSCNFATAVKAYASWGFFDYRMKDEGFGSGYQSVPVDWGINSERKRAFFKKLREIAIE